MSDSASAPSEGTSDVLVMAKPAGPHCNLACQYCYYLSRDRLFPPGASRRMPEDLLERYIAQRLETGGPKVHFEWHGGEPTTLGLAYFRRIVALQQRHRKPGQAITNGLQTNGTLLDADWARFLAEAKFAVGLSLDGPLALHDAYRGGRDQRSTHRKVVKAFELLRKRRVHTDVLCVVHALNVSEPLAVYRFFKDLGVRYLQFLPLVEPRVDPPGVSPRTPSAEAVGEFLCAIFDEWRREDVGRVVVQWFDEAMRPACELPHALCLFRETCGEVLALEHDGSLCPCDHFVDDDHRLGSLRDEDLATLLRRPARFEFGQRKRDELPSMCRRCDVLPWCNGGCPKDRIRITAEGELGLNYLCAGFQRFFRHCQPAMTELAARWRSAR